MTAIALTLMFGNWNLVGDSAHWELVDPPIVKPDTPKPEPPPPKLELPATGGCANGQCGVPTRGWRRRR